MWMMQQTATSAAAAGQFSQAADQTGLYKE
jgi:hypothetical protein